MYFDRAGFGSQNRTLEEALEKDKTITMSDISKFFRHVDQKRKPVGSNSLVAPRSGWEYQMDLFFFVIWRTKNLRRV